jgi:hypothetical protein
MAKYSKIKKWIPYLALILVVAVVVSWYVYAQSPAGNPPTPVAKSSFTITSYVDGEDVSGLVPMSVWVPKAGETFDSPDDYQDLTKYTETVSSTVASLVSIDLSDYGFFIAEVQPTGATSTPFANNYKLYYTNGENKVYNLDGYDQATDVDGVVVDSTMSAITIADYATDGNFTCFYDVPHYTTTAAQLHYGTNWDLTAAEFADLTAAQQQEYWDEKYWTGEFGTFVSGDYVYKSVLAHPNLASFTNVFAFELTFNDSVSIVDGAATQVNFTLTDDNAYFEVCYSADKIYLASYAPITFLNGAKQLHCSIQFADNITLSTWKSVRLPIEQSGNAFGTAVALSSF